MTSELSQAGVAAQMELAGSRGRQAINIPPIEDKKLENRASASPSLYVKSQADSPVAWQLLDNETVERARRENKLIFLNIGFKASHCKKQTPHIALLC
jgi:hypothetical protein